MQCLKTYQSSYLLVTGMEQVATNRMPRHFASSLILYITLPDKISAVMECLRVTPHKMGTLSMSLSTLFPMATDSSNQNTRYR
ncbi:hypothetical protein GBAR_LOCUS11824 [Geodia barretti]|uniref:Uncharacterized protein n=1 Tax=Geodia barretti TaxID=519541 RepID=A0AA35WMB3_GEOBA|nr:hypothetical protein GBAR_LOCUS11824 [Geodia barretti]